MSVLIFLGVLFVLVLVHELGHFVTAKWTGMRVDEFGIGFPPRLFGMKRGETEYTFNLFPVGGFVKIAGEDATDVASSPVSSGTRDRRSEALAEAGEGGEDGDVTTGRLFSDKSKWAQSAVLLAGITMNIVFAWLLVTIAFTMGVESSVAEEEATEGARLTVTNVLPGSPAERAGLAPGSLVKSVESKGDTLTDLKPSTFSAFVESHGDAPLTILYTAGEELRVAQLTAEKNTIPSDAERPAVGVALSLVDTVERSLLESAKDSFVYTVTGLRDITLGIGSLIFDAVRFRADLSQVAGPVGIVGLVGEASAYGITALLMFTAFISLNLAVINVLPFPALDGGRLLFVLIEAVKGSPIRAEYAGMLNTVGFFILILLMVAVTWNDVARLI
jgi:regulator of sigma E protease